MDFLSSLEKSLSHQEFKLEFIQSLVSEYKSDMECRFFELNQTCLILKEMLKQNTVYLQALTKAVEQAKNELRNANQIGERFGTPQLFASMDTSIVSIPNTPETPSISNSDSVPMPMSPLDLTCHESLDSTASTEIEPLIL